MIGRATKGIYRRLKKPIFTLISKIEIYLMLQKKRDDRNDYSSLANKRVLVLGVYLAQKKNCAEHLANEFFNCKSVSVTQAWIAIGESIPENGILKTVTRELITNRVPKFTLMNKLITQFNLQNYDYIIFTDDDIVVPKGFLEKFIDIQENLGFSIAQPARTYFSEIGHKITRRKHRLIARETSFVEIGPLFSIHQEIFNEILPFDEVSPMGWGYDLVWPHLISRKNLKMGIIDRTPINHSIRPTAAYYSNTTSIRQMEQYLEKNSHYDRNASYITHKIYK